MFTCRSDSSSQGHLRVNGYLKLICYICSYILCNTLWKTVLPLTAPDAHPFLLLFWTPELFTPYLLLSLFHCFILTLSPSPPVELSSLSLCMTNSKQGEPCFYVIGRTENTRLVTLPDDCLSSRSPPNPCHNNVVFFNEIKFWCLCFTGII